MSGELRRAEAAAAVQRLLSLALRDPAAVARLVPRDLDLLLRVARRVRLLARLAVQLDELGLLAGLPPTAQEQLRSARVLAEARVRSALWELRWLARLLTRAGLRVIALKGCAYVLGGLPNAKGRAFADVDLLLEERELERGERLLLEMGWESKSITPYDQHYYRAWTHELPPMVHPERGVEADLHHNVIARTARLSPSAPILLDAVRRIDGTEVYRLSNPDLVLHAMTHLMFDSDMADCLRDLVDIDDLVRHFSAEDAEFFDALLARARALDLARPAFYALRYSHRLLGTPVPDDVLRASRKGAPPAPIVRCMDRLVPLALFPRHPDRPSRAAAAARFLLYVRSLWIRMPPMLLARHLTYKSYVRLRAALAGRGRK